MSLIEFPNPVSWFEAAATGKVEREALKVLLSSLYSSYITLLYETGKKKLWGEGKALQRTALATYLSLGPLVAKGELVLTVPKEMFDADEMARFQTEWQGTKL